MLLAGMPFTKLLSTLSNFGSSLLKEIRLHHGCGLFFVLWQCREKMCAGEGTCVNIFGRHAILYRKCRYYENNLK